MKRISDKINISFDTNEIFKMNDDNLPSKTKVEPRIMQVLQILIKNSPDVVSREQLIEEVWDNYGGADDALNQAVSHLRKMLNDTDKENRIIETVVKKGYRFTKGIEASSQTPKKNFFESIKPKTWIIITAIAFLSVFLIFYISTSEKTSKNRNDTLAPEAPVHKENSTKNDNDFVPEADETNNQ